MHRFCSAATYIAATLLIAFAGWSLWQRFASRAARSVRLADGRQLTIREVTYGTNHSFVYGSLWSRVAMALLPASLKARSGAKVYFQHTATPALLIWGEWQLPKGSYPAQML